MGSRAASRLIATSSPTSSQFLKANAHARATYTIPAPSWHRIYWHTEHSTGAYTTSDDFIRDVARLSGYTSSIG
jgi:hypothetical protein